MRLLIVTNNMKHNHKKELMYNSTGQDYWCKECGKLWEDIIDEQVKGIVAIIFTAIGVIIGIVGTCLWIG